MTFDLFLPWPPSVNHYYVKTRRGQFISAKGRKYRAHVAEAVNEQLPGIFIQEPMLVECILHPPDKRTRDLGNYDKAMMDALTICKFWEDDSLIDQQFFYRGEAVKGGQVVMRVCEAGPVLKWGQTPPD